MLRRILSLAVLSLVASALPAASETPPPTSPAGYVRPDAPGRLVDVGEGRRLHIRCKGDAPGPPRSGEATNGPREAGSRPTGPREAGSQPTGPSVIFEAGLSQHTANSTYGVAQDAIASFARVCTYDRAGLGWSDPAPAEWTQAAMVSDLHRLLAAAEVPGPYVLVAHSLGGLLARTYAQTYPKEVAGVVLVDATSDRNFAELAAARATVVPQIDAAVANAKPGVPVIGLPAGTSPEIALAFTPEVLRGVKAEFEALDRLPAAMKQPGGFGGLGDLPLIVIRRGKTAQPPSAADVDHREGQEALAALSSNSTLVVAENSGHTIPLDEPQVVADAVRRMLQALQIGAPLSQRTEAVAARTAD